MRRRTFVAGMAAVVVAVPWAGRAQQVGKVHQIGWLHSASAEPRVTFREALRERGYIEGKHIAYEVRTADGYRERLPRLADELVRSKVDIIVAVAPPAIRAAKAATSSIPIVMAYWGGPDLVESGVVASLNRPGGNITGVHMLNTALDGKRLELLIEAVPRARNIAVAVHNLPLSDPQLKPIRATAELAGRALFFADVGTDQPAYNAAFDSMKRAGAEGALFPSSPIFLRDRHIIIELAARHRIPAMYEWPSMARDGGLMGYSAGIPEMDRQVATLVDKILKGAKPADLPIEQPTKFELVINLKTARAIGLTIPQSLLLRADEVIQ